MSLSLHRDSWSAQRGGGGRDLGGLLCAERKRMEMLRGLYVCQRPPYIKTVCSDKDLSAGATLGIIGESTILGEIVLVELTNKIFKMYKCMFYHDCCSDEFQNKNNNI